MLSRSKQFLFFCLALIIGVGIRSLINVPFIVIFFVLWLEILAFVIFYKNRNVRIIFLGLLFIILGTYRYEFSVPQFNEKEIQYYNGQQVEFVGIISKEPDVRKDHIKLTVKTEKLFLENERTVSGLILIKAGLYPEYNYGDKVEVKCYLSKPEKIEDFSYDKYLSRYDIYSVCYRPEYIKLTEKDKGNFIIKYLLLFKNKFVESINKILPEPQASFLGGLLLGAKRGIPEEVMNNFNRTGTTHIVAISGYNITIIASVLESVLISLYISRKKRFWFVVLGILFFVIITGAQASVVRAAIMGYLVFIARHFGRLSNATNAIIFTGALMIFINPKILVFDVGFQLSFLATMGLIYLTPIVEKYLFWLPEKLALRESMTQTLSAIIMTTPIILYNFSRLSLVAPLANILILPIIPWAMAVGFITGAVGLLAPTIAQIIGWLVWFLLSYVLFVAKFLAGLNFALIDLGKFPTWMMVLMYLIIFVWIYFDKRRIIDNKLSMY